MSLTLTAYPLLSVTAHVLVNWVMMREDSPLPFRALVGEVGGNRYWRWRWLSVDSSPQKIEFTLEQLGLVFVELLFGQAGIAGSVENTFDLIDALHDAFLCCHDVLPCVADVDVLLYGLCINNSMLV